MDCGEKFCSNEELGMRNEGGGFAAPKGSQPRLAALGSPFPNGEGYDTRAPLSPYHQSEYMHVWKNNTPDTKPSPRGEGGEQSEPDRVLAA